MKYLLHIPFFYFQQSRLRTVKDFAFHLLFEWLPALALILLYAGATWLRAVELFFTYYVAFIAIYEMGYLMNDQQALSQPRERQRMRKLSVFELLFFIGVRLAVFGSVTVWASHTTNLNWWAWYAVLACVFFAHNVISGSTVKCGTFSVLAFLRFFSPVFMALESSLLTELALPVFINYVLFRLFGYMDSKNLLLGFDRSRASFRIGYYLAISGISVPLAVVTGSGLPLLINAYFLGASSIGVVFLQAKARIFN